MDRQISSEEKLLRLIREKDSAKKTKNPVAQKLGADGQIKGKKSDPKAEEKGQDVLKNINILLVLCVLGIIGYMVMNFMIARESNTAIPVAVKEDESQEKIGVEGKLELPEPKPFSYYAEKINSSNVFVAPWEKEQTGDGEKAAQNPLQQQPTINLTQMYKVTGIVLDQDPKAIIENLNTNEVLFLSKGQKLDEATLIEIQETKIIFEYQNQKIELIYE